MYVCDSKIFFLKIIVLDLFPVTGKKVTAINSQEKKSREKVTGKQNHTKTKMKFQHKKTVVNTFGVFSNFPMYVPRDYLV